MGLNGLKEKLKSARQNGFIFDRINKLTKKIDSNLSRIHICWYLKFPISFFHRRFFEYYYENQNK